LSLKNQVSLDIVFITEIILHIFRKDLCSNDTKNDVKLNNRTKMKAPIKRSLHHIKMYHGKFAKAAKFHNNISISKLKKLIPCVEDIVR
jgi:50S ribosomal subunit-associated GTPase HflX